MKEYDSQSFYIVLESSIIKNKNLSNTEKILYSIICYYSNNKDGYCYKTYEQLANIINIKNRQFIYCVNNLLNSDYIRKIKTTKRTYLAPTLNVIMKLKEQKPKEFNKIFSYDWLGDEKNE